MYLIKTYQQQNNFLPSVNVMITNVIINCLQGAKLVIYFFCIAFHLLKKSLEDFYAGTGKNKTVV
jgi:hypothetical protein